MNDTDTKKELIRIAQELLEGKLHIISGCRIITGLSCDTNDPDDDIYIPFRAVDSETDHLPMGSVRELCEPDYLVRVDKEINRYVALENEDIQKSCIELIKKLTTEISIKA